jgi:hypothetical protein
VTARRCLVVLLIAAAFWMAWLAVYQVDDAFIVYRYARSLAHGDGFVFNPGERVEGVTCFLWTLAMTPFAAIGLPLPRVGPVLSAIAGLLCLALTALIHAESDGRDRLAMRDLLAPLLLASAPPYAYWSVGALETVPFALILTLAAREHARERCGAPGLRSAAWLGVASLIRPETPLIVATLAIDRLHRRGWAGAARWLGVIGAIFGPFLIFRRFYFGDWLPNTYYAKTGAPLSVQIAMGWRYVRACLASLTPSFGYSGEVTVLLGALLLIALLAFAWRRSSLRSHAIVVVAVGTAAVLEGGDWMVLARFWVPALPCLAVIASAALWRLSERRPVGAAVAAALVVATIANGLTEAANQRNGGQGLLVNAQGYRHAHREIARYLNEHAETGDKVALMDVGMIGWYADRLRVIDITGLTDRDIAHAPGGFLDKHFDVASLLARDVRFIVLVEGFPADDRIYQAAEFRSHYTSLFKLDHRSNWNPPSSYRMFVFERSGR